MNDSAVPNSTRMRLLNAYARTVRLLLVMSAFVAACVECSGAASEADQLREELQQLKQEYQQRIEVLEERLRRLEAAQAVPGTNVAVVQPAAVPTPPRPVPVAASMTNATAETRQFAKEQFQQYTVSREEGGPSEYQPLRERVEHVLQDFVDVNGYFRAGYGRDDKGGPQVAFQAPGALSKYRLGNEAENYGELTFGKNFYVPDLFSLNRSCVLTALPPARLLACKPRFPSTIRTRPAIPVLAYRKRLHLLATCWKARLP